MPPTIYCLHDIRYAPAAFQLQCTDSESKNRDHYVFKFDETVEGEIHQILIFTDGIWPNDYPEEEIDIYLNDTVKFCTLTKFQRCFLWCKDNCKEGYELLSEDKNQIQLSASLRNNTVFSTPHSSKLSEGEIMKKNNETTPEVSVPFEMKENTEHSKIPDTPLTTKTSGKQHEKKNMQVMTPSTNKEKKRQRDKENTNITPKLKSARSRGGSRIFGHEKTPPSKQMLAIKDSASSTVSKAICCSHLSRVPKPSNRWGHSLCSIDGNKAILIGGQGNKMQLSKDSIWLLDTDLRTWKSSNVTTEGVKPEYRTGHSATYDPVMRCIYVFGGSKNSKWFHDVYMYDLDEQKWTQVKVNGKAPTRAYHSTTLYRHELWIFGGVFPRPDPQPDGCDNEIHIFSPVMEGWYKPIVTGEKPLPRSGHSANLVDDRLVVFGGWDFPYCYNDISILDLSTVDWSAPKVVGQPPKPRCWAASSTLSNSRLFIHGGYDGDNPLNDAFIFDLGNYTWQSLVIDNAPSPRAGHSSIHLCSKYENKNEDEIIIFGGGDNDGNFFSDMVSFYIPHNLS